MRLCGGLSLPIVHIFYELMQVALVFYWWSLMHDVLPEPIACSMYEAK